MAGNEAEAPDETTADRPNVLLVTVDCLRGDFVGTESAFADTPFIDSLVESGVHYADMYTTTTTTTPAVTSYMTGCYSEHNGVYSLEEARVDADVPTLAEQFDAAGYETRAMVTGPIVADTGLDRGFDDYAYRDRREELIGDWYDEAVETVDSLSEPFFLYLHLWEIHTPIETPPEYDDEQYGRWPYARTLSALDRSLQSFCQRLPADTAIALHGDHGESIAWRHSLPARALWYVRAGLRYTLGLDTRSIERSLKRRFSRTAETGLADHFIEEGHGENVFDFAANVPFVLAHESVESATVDSQVRQVDVFPTLLDLAGIDVDHPIDGESLLPASEVDDRVAYMRACGKSLVREDNWQRAVRTDGRKYVEYPNRDWDYELYDLDADPAELNPIEDDAVAGRMEARIPSEEVRAGEELEIDGLLEDLGYK
jgi:arylsulfatase A-like enzyme